MRLPGDGAYNGDDPDGFMLRDEIVEHLERYAAGFDALLREGVDVASLEAAPEGGYLVRTSAGDIRAASVVVCTGAYQRPRPAGADTLPSDLVQKDLDDYRNPDALPPGNVLLIGSGQSGCQIAEELNEGGRDVFLACGRAPWGNPPDRRPRRCLVGSRNRVPGPSG